MADDRSREQPSSRARQGGAARPVPPRRTTRPDEEAPPSFAPGGQRPRPSAAGSPPVVVGAPRRPAQPTGRPAQVPPARPPVPPQPAAAPTTRGTGGRTPVPPSGTARSSRPPAQVPGPGQDAGTRPQGARPPVTRPPVARPGARRRRLRLAGIALLLLLALAIAWPVGLLIWANGRIQHVAALSGTPDTTPGTTYLLAGSDVRGEAGGLPVDGTEGARTDTVMVLHVPTSGPSALISLPRDTYVDIPGYGPNKLNAAYAFGGPALLVQTVEGLTGLHIDHYAEIGLGGVAQIVDAVGGVELCMDPAVNMVTFPVNDPESGMVWDGPGCRVVAGPEALAFARMRKADHEGDIGRGKRQQQLIASVASTVADPSLVWQPTRQVSLIRTGLQAITVSEGTDIIDMGRLALAFRDATGPEGIRGTPPLASLDYRPGNVGSTVLIDEATAPAFWEQIVAGSLPPGPVGGVPQG